jgi:hypothetical protein
MRSYLLTGLILAGLSCGCGGSERPELATVRGKVTLKGQPVPLAKVIFMPVNGSQSSSGETGPSGDYELYFRYEEPGAEIGKHKISISTYEPPEVTDDGKKQGGRAEMVPKQYNTESSLERDVVAGENVIDLEL